MLRKYKGTILVQAMFSYFLLLFVGLFFAPMIIKLQESKMESIHKRAASRFLYECTADWIRLGKPDTYFKKVTMENEIFEVTGNKLSLTVTWEGVNHEKETLTTFEN